MWAYAAIAAAQLVGGYQQADIIRQQAGVQQSVQELNANYADLDALHAEQNGFSESARYATVADSTIGQQRANLAGAGVDVNYGTAADIQADSKITAMLNTLEIQRQGREKALGFKIQAINTRLGGAMTQLQGQLNASSVQNQALLSAARTGVSGYERYDSTGKGNTSRSGSSDTPTYRNASSNNNMAGGAGDANSHQPAWFFGDNPSRYSQPSFYSPEHGDQLFA